MTARRTLAALAAGLGAATAVAMVILWPGGNVSHRLGELGFASDAYAATVTDVEVGPCAHTTEEQGIRCRRVELRLEQGPDRGDTTSLDFPTDATTTPVLSRGDRLILSYAPEAEPGFEYDFADRDRKGVLIVLSAVFAVAVVGLGRVRGIAALAGLVASFAVLLKFLLPAILQGTSPLVAAVVGSAAVAFVALYLAHGFGPMTHVALLGTIASLGLTVVLAHVFVGAARFSGFATEEAVFLSLAEGEIDVAGLILGGIVIGALGAIDDMTVTQASVVWELRTANPTLGRVRLFAAGMRIGRDHVASTVNTLALAYAGAAMPLLVLFVLVRQSLGTIANSEVIATEVVRTLAGSVGLVASVPITTWLAVLVVEGRPGVRKPPQPRESVSTASTELGERDGI